LGQRQTRKKRSRQCKKYCVQYQLCGHILNVGAILGRDTHCYDMASGVAYSTIAWIPDVLVLNTEVFASDLEILVKF
jgi:hypothetical protein